MSSTSPLVSTEWLAERLGQPDLVLVESTVLPVSGGYVTGHELYLLEGHIPGAVFADMIEDFSEPGGAYPFTRPSRERLQASAEALGIGDGKTVVLYDRAAGQWAARLWWVLRSHGVEVLVLNGGFTRWLAEGRETELGHVEPTPASLTLGEPRPELWVDKDDVQAIVAGEAKGTLICAVPAREFSGELGSRPRLGHIPGSTSVPVGSLLDRLTNTFAEEGALRDTFGEVLQAPRVISYCAGGIAATADALALTVLGHPNVAVYDGSLNEWAADPDAPLATTV